MEMINERLLAQAIREAMMEVPEGKLRRPYSRKVSIRATQLYAYKLLQKGKL